MDDFKVNGLLDWLTGSTNAKPNYEGFISATPQLKVLNSPLSYYLRQINRFIFSGGVTISPVENDPVNLSFLEQFNKETKLTFKFTKLLKRVAITGEVAFVWYLNEKGTNFNLQIFEKDEYRIEDDGTLVAQVVVIKKGIRYIKRIKANSTEVCTYPLVKENQKDSVDWEKLKIPVNAYNLPSYTLIMADVDLETSRGCRLFDYAVLQMALMQLALALDISENIHFFGQPKYGSSSPDELLKAIKNRSQVLPKEPDDSNGGIDVLNPPSVDSVSVEWVNDYDRKILRSLGINPRFETDISGDISSLALRLINQETIDVAEDIWAILVEGGLAEFYYNLSATAAASGIIPKASEVAIVRNKPYFHKSAGEIQAELTNALSLAELGASPLVMIEEIYKDRPDLFQKMFSSNPL